MSFFTKMISNTFSKIDIKKLSKDPWKLIAATSLTLMILSLVSTIFLLGDKTDLTRKTLEQNESYDKLLKEYNDELVLRKKTEDELYKEQKLNLELTEKYNALLEEDAANKEKADFLDNYIVIVGKDRTFFHRNDCKLIESDTFWAFNIDAAFEMGFRPCRYCMY